MIKDNILNAIFILMMCAFVFYMSIYINFNPLPIVRWSASKNKCVEIITFNDGAKDTCDCESMPERYTKEYVQ